MARKTGQTIRRGSPPSPDSRATSISARSPIQVASFAASGGPSYLRSWIAVYLPSASEDSVARCRYREVILAMLR